MQIYFLSLSDLETAIGASVCAFQVVPAQPAMSAGSAGSAPVALAPFRPAVWNDDTDIVAETLRGIDVRGGKADRRSPIPR